MSLDPKQIFLSYKKNDNTIDEEKITEIVKN
jgi:hypothetical protein